MEKQRKRSRPLDGTHLSSQDLPTSQSNRLFPCDIKPELVFECINCICEYIPFSNLNDNQFDIAVSKGVNYLADFNLQTSLTPSQQSILDKIEVTVHDTAPDHGDDDNS